MRFFAVIIFVNQGFFALAQHSPIIRSSRPGQSVVPFTTGKNVFQVQTGFTYNPFYNSAIDFKRDVSTYLASLRYGVLEKLEIRSAFGLSHNRDIVEGSLLQRYGGFSLWNVGLRYNLLDGGGGPSLGIQPDLKLTAVDEDYAAARAAPRLMLIYAQNLGANLGFTTNWAAEWGGDNSGASGTYTLNLSFPLWTEKWGGFIENYGSFGSGDFDNRWNTGLSYLVNNDFLLDASAGYGQNDGVSDWFLDAGVSWRIKFRGNKRL